jgi:hypothetical protein
MRRWGDGEIRGQEIKEDTETKEEMRRKGIKRIESFGNSEKFKHAERGLRKWGSILECLKKRTDEGIR